MRRDAARLPGLLPLLLGVLAAPAASRAATPFDGHWAVRLVCDRTTDGALPYTFNFTGEVRDGLLHAEHGTSGQPGWLVIEGRIGPDGDAALLADGLTGQPSYNLARLTPGLAYTYRIRAHFEPGHGSGARVSGARACAVEFSRL